MGTTWKVIAIAPGARSERLRRETADLLETLEAKCSHYREESEISRFNRAAAHVAVPVSAETAQLVSHGERMRETSRGAFDIRVARAVAARGFGPDALAAETQARRKTPGTITVGTDPPSLTKDDSALAVDLSAFAKGHAVDRVAALLDQHGVHHYLVEIGGELRAKGTKPDGEPWSVGVEAPNPDGRVLHLGVTLDNEAIASSGNYRLFHRQDDGRLESHLVDPRGREDQAETVFRSVSVILPEAMHADAWATTLFVLGGSEGPRLARELEIPACFLRLTNDGGVEEQMVAGFDRRVFR